MAAPNDAESLRSQLASVETQFAMIERVARIGYWWWFPDSDQHFWSPGFYALLGADAGTQLPSQEFFSNCIHPQDRDRVHNTFRQARAQRRPHVCRFRFARDPGRIFAVRGDAQLGPDCEPVAFFAAFQDVTDLIRVERERDQAHDMYRLIAEQASDVITLRSADGGISLVSPSVREVMGLDPKAFSIDVLLSICHPDDRANMRNYTSHVPQPGEIARLTCRVRHQTQDREVWVETSKRAVYDPEGQLLGVVAVTRDITEGKEAEMQIRAAQERAETANSAKSRFLANMSHELRTPLNAIIGFADILRQQMFGTLGERYIEYSTLIYDSGQLLLDLISDILDMAKIDAGKMDLNYEPVDARALLEDCVRLLRERADKGDIELRTSVPTAHVVFDADRRSVKQILLNLLSNALKFTPPGGNVAATLAVDGDVIVFGVSDNGIGIPAADLPRLGRPFEQVVADPLLAQSGTGLGLALVRALAERHGGTIRIESEEGSGTRVTVRLPRTRAPVPAAAA